ncbi:MAG: InlB B-repeat-containing protein [Lachnospiraceae bacterium]|nr:InlB B-repeat-containing protein [Lachnospiraceae bacterium]
MKTRTWKKLCRTILAAGLCFALVLDAQTAGVFAAETSQGIEEAADEATESEAPALSENTDDSFMENTDVEKSDEENAETEESDEDLLADPVDEEEPVVEEYDQSEEFLNAVTIPDNPAIYTVGNTESVELTEAEYNGWYKFTWDKTCVGRIRNTATKGQNTVPSADLYIYDASGNFLLAKYKSGTMFFSLLKGTYYIRYQSYSHEGTVSFQINTYDADNHYQSFEESYQDSSTRNNSESTASVLTAGNVYHGLVGRNNAVDWYTFTLTESTYVQISQVDFYNDYYGTVKIMDSNKNDVLKQSEINAKDAISSTVLKPGKYYAYAERFNYSNNDNGITSYRIVLGEEATEEYKPFQPVLYPAYILGETKNLDLSVSHTKWYQLNLEKSSIIKARMSHTLSDYVPSLRIYDLTFHKYLDTNGAHIKYIGLLKGIYLVEVYEGNLTSGSVSFDISAVESENYFQTYEEAYHNRSVRNNTKLDANVIDSVPPYAGHQNLEQIRNDPFCSAGKTIYGIIGNNNNEDWYKVTASGKLVIDIKEEYYANYSNALIVYDENKTPVTSSTISSEGTEGGRKTVVRQCCVNPGTYYIRAQRFNYNNNQSEAAMAYKIGLTEIKTIPIEPDTYYDEDPAVLGDGFFYYRFSVENDNTVMDLSVDFASAPTEPENVICLYNSKGEQLTVRNEGYSLVTNPQILTFDEGHKIVFRRIKLNQGDYYFTIKQTKTTSDPTLYGFSDPYAIYITTHKEGFDLAKNTFPIANEAVLFRLKRDAFGNLIVKDNHNFMPEEPWKEVYGEFQTDAYDLSNEVWKGYCCGMATASLLNYEGRLNLGATPSPWNYFYTDKNIKYPKANTDYLSTLEKTFGVYQVWQFSDQCSKQRDNNHAKYMIDRFDGKKTINYESLKAALDNGKHLIFTFMYWNVLSELSNGSPPEKGGHTLAIDTCREILKIPNKDQSGLDWYRLYLYDCNTPFYEPYSVNGCPNGCLKQYDQAENRYIDICQNGEWVAHNIGVNAGAQMRDVTSDDGLLGLGESYICIDDTSMIPDSFNWKAKYATEDNDKIKIFNKYVKTYGSNNGIKTIKKDGRVLFKVEKYEDTLALPTEVFAYYIGSEMGTTSQSADCIYEIPKDMYTYELTGGVFEILCDENLVKLSTEDTVIVDMTSGSAVILSSNEETNVDIVVSEIDTEEETYNKIRTTLTVTDEPIAVNVIDGKVSIESDEEQVITLELENESGKEVIENLSTDDIDDFEIEKHINGFKVTFDEQGGSDVNNISGITANTCVQMPVTRKEDFNFEGWFTQKDGKGKQYTSTTPIDQNLTLYAYWVEKSTTDPDEDEIPDDAPNGIWLRGLEEEYTYTGSPIKPSFRVYRGKTRLYEQTDYTLKFANNTKPGTAKVTVTMKGNYSGATAPDDVTFKIVPASLKDDITADTMYVLYKKNKAQKPKPVLYVNGAKLKYGANDLAFTYPSVAVGEERPYVDPGTYKIHIAPKNTNLFKDEMDVDLVIIDRVLMSAVTVSANKSSLPYDNGKPVSPVFTLKYKGEALTENKDYTVSYADDHTSIGKHVVTFTGTNTDYFGTKTYTFSITGKYDLTSDLADITLDPSDLDGDGSALFTYGGAMPGAIVKYNGVKLTAGKDYTVSYTNHKALGTATATIKGKGSYTGRLPLEYSVKARDINTLNLILQDVVYSTKKDAYKKASLTFVDQNYVNQKLKVNTDYSLVINGEYADAPAPGTVVNVTITGLQNYTGTINSSYRIIDKAVDLSKAKVTVNGGKAYDYTGSEVKPVQGDLQVQLANQTLNDDCYEIVGYYNNIKKGNNAYVRLRGKGSYGGEKVVKFKIGAAPLKELWSAIIIRLKSISL